MVENPKKLIKDFYKYLQIHYPNFDIEKIKITHELISPPHKNIRLKEEHSAIYVFSLNYNYDKCLDKCRVLKVGKVSKNSIPRFQNQHYLDNSTGSTLAKSINNNPLLWDYLGINYSLDKNKITINEDVSNWLKLNTDRDHFFLYSQYESKLLDILESFIRGILGSVYEGSLLKR